MTIRSAAPAWLFVATLAACCSVLIVVRFERPLRETRAEIAQAYQRIAADNDVLQHANALRAGEKSARRTFAPVSGVRNAAEMTARAIDVVQTLSRRWNVHVTRFEPQSPSTSTAQKPPVLVTTPLTIEVRGSYRQIMHFIADVTRGPSIIGVDGVTISRAAAATDLDVTVQATVSRLSPIASSGLK